MGQVLHNLLTNAIRYSRKTDREVVVSAKLTEKEIHIRVESE